MMSEIKRYDFYWLPSQLAESKRGSYVLFKDHEAQLAAVQRERDFAKKQESEINAENLQYEQQIAAMMKERDEANAQAAAMREYIQSILNNLRHISGTERLAALLDGTAGRELLEERDRLRRAHDAALGDNDRAGALINRWWPSVLEIYISPLSQPNRITGWQVELLLLAPSPRCPVVDPYGNTKSFQSHTLSDAFRQAEEWMELNDKEIKP